MPQKRDLDPTASPAHFFGAEVRREREARKMSQPALGKFIPCDGSQVSRVEGGEWPSDVKFAEGCDKAFPERGGWFTRFYEGSPLWADLPAWFIGFAVQESRATVIRWYEPLLVPGLLQTGPYARAILGWKPDSTDAESNLAGRLERQRILDRDNPPELRILLTESVLYYEVGDASVMADQCAHLATLAERPFVSIQVVPEVARAYGGRGGGFAIATEGTTDVAAYLESSVHGVTVTDATMITRAVRVFDALRTDALSWTATLDLLHKAVERWNT